MTNTHDSESVQCRDIDHEKLFEQGIAPEAYHDFQEVAQGLISVQTCCEIGYIEERCSRCSARFSGLQILGDVPKSMQDLKWITDDVYDTFYEDPRPVHHVAMGPDVLELGQEAVMELFKLLQLTAGLAREDKEDGTGKRSKQDLWARVLGPEHANTN
ncbi:hypothetical protein C496_14471 [Natronorubrum tibetense GA33]|uniref:Uncharacterized protein n=2 Tax=Natronorubrum tibetense TaxID=63128 RepID=L9VRR4_9EURY|nr:hypothetical protein C496_14471 [Natronorubrum tibetense GA33]